jgi:hypothetical protein
MNLAVDFSFWFAFALVRIVAFAPGAFVFYKLSIDALIIFGAVSFVGFGFAASTFCFGFDIVAAFAVFDALDTLEDAVVVVIVALEAIPVAFVKAGWSVVFFVVAAVDIVGPVAFGFAFVKDKPVRTSLIFVSDSIFTLVEHVALAFDTVNAIVAFWVDFSFGGDFNVVVVATVDILCPVANKQLWIEQESRWTLLVWESSPMVALIVEVAFSLMWMDTGCALGFDFGFSWSVGGVGCFGSVNVPTLAEDAFVPVPWFVIFHAFFVALGLAVWAVGSRGARDIFWPITDEQLRVE